MVVKAVCERAGEGEGKCGLGVVYIIEPERGDGMEKTNT